MRNTLTWSFPAFPKRTDKNFRPAGWVNLSLKTVPRQAQIGSSLALCVVRDQSGEDPHFQPSCTFTDPNLLLSSALLKNLGTRGVSGEKVRGNVRIPSRSPHQGLVFQVSYRSEDLLSTVILLQYFGAITVICHCESPYIPPRYPFERRLSVVLPACCRQKGGCNYGWMWTVWAPRHRIMCFGSWHDKKWGFVVGLKC